MLEEQAGAEYSCSEGLSELHHLGQKVTSGHVYRVQTSMISTKPGICV